MSNTILTVLCLLNKTNPRVSVYKHWVSFNIHMSQLNFGYLMSQSQTTFHIENTIQSLTMYLYRYHNFVMVTLLTVFKSWTQLRGTIQYRTFILRC